MGMDPVSQVEVFEVTIQISGKTAVAGFDDFQALLRTFIADASNIIADATVNPPATLNVRVVRQAVRPSAQ